MPLQIVSRATYYYPLAGVLLAVALFLLLFLKRKNIKKQLLLDSQLIQKKNDYLKAIASDNDIMLLEREQLLQKVHHRVKNNLQIVMSLFNAQSTFISNQAAKDALSDSQLKLQTMLIINKRRYGSNGINLIHIPEFINELSIFLSENYQHEFFVLEIRQEIAQVHMDIQQAGNIGLFINEVVANTVKGSHNTRSSLIINIELVNLKEEYKLCIYFDSTLVKTDDIEKNLENSFFRQIGIMPVILHGRITRVFFKFFQPVGIVENTFKYNHSLNDD